MRRRGAGAGSPSERLSVFDFEQWVHLEAIQAIVHHATAAVAAVILFAVTARLITYLMPAGHAKRIVIIFDDVILLAVFALCGWRLMTYLWAGPNERIAHASAAVALAAPATVRADRGKAMEECRAAAKTRADLRKCLEHKAAQAQKVLDRTALSVRSEMQALDQHASVKIDAEQRFEAAQEAFVQYRDAQCKWRAAAAGNILGTVYQACMADVTSARVAQLEQALRK
jgi:uncharacterized protein YecT (DUF1311 family)